MIAALFILSALSSSSAPGAPTRGAALVPPRRVAVEIAGGVTGVFPTFGLRVTTGAARWLDVSAGIETYAGLVNSTGIAARLRFAPNFGARLGVDYAFAVVDDLGGIRTADAPFANGLTTTVSLLASLFRGPGAHIAFGLGLTSRWVAPRVAQDGTVVTGFAPAPAYNAHAEVAAEWPVRGGTVYLLFRAVVPIQAELQVLGYFPTLLVGRTWGLP